VDGKPTLTKEAFAGWRSKFDVRGNRIETAFFGTDGQPALRKDGYARVVSEYDERNLPIKTFYFDAQGKPVTGRVVVVAVRPGSQGERLGLRPDDVLSAYNGEPITDWVSLVYRRRSERSRGGPSELRISRGDTTLSVTLSPGLLGATLKDDCRPVAKSVAADPAKVQPLKQAAAIGSERH
jgi:S1-C subfamily serine protease